jgi:predicted metal-dependent phosphoesterase TrpH
MSLYSDWIKVDLHIHTDYSKKTKTNDYQGIFDIAVLKQKLIENDVKLFSMTDHNIINVEAYENYYTNYNEEIQSF